ncbi:exocyst complex component EXO70C1-like [Musa acuminata AAA Group]|uniref:exocyst complex component EXO70C1-like n=1 Tax=Musa acuminata AAA Group TaxID=214697 RepID=UPI0031E2B8F5
MECNQPHVPKKSSSFSSSRDEKHREINRNLSLGSIKLEQSYEKKERHDQETIEEEREEEKATKEQEEEKEASNDEEPEATLLTISEDIDRFLRLLLAVEDGQDGSHEPPEIPESTVEKFVILVEEEIAKYETGEEKWPSCDDELSLLDAIDRVSKLTSAVAKFSSELKYNEAMNHSGSVLHHAMCFLEDEFHSLLQDSRTKQEAASSSSRPKQLPSLIYRFHEPERSVSPSSESSPCESSQAYIPENTERLHRIADAMISAGYVTECCQVFSIARRNAFEAGLPSLGFEKVGIEDVIKMAWENLESEIATWVKAFRHTITASFTAERELCEAVFASHRAISDRLFLGFANGAIVQLLTFAEAVTMTKRSAEKLFKVLDVYEAMRDVLPTVEALLPDDGEKDEPSVFADPKTEISSLRYRLGEAAVAIFCDLESSIKADNSKTPVPGGAVHPLTRYVMNYLKYACEYKSTLEQVFKEHKHAEKPSSFDEDRENSQTGGGGDGDRNSNSSGNDNYNPFAAQLIEVMDLLHSNLESKSKLYKDLALSNIFLMNNGRYIAKKVKGSPEIHQLLGETWYRKRSSDLRQYHKNYQRETWSKLLACLRDDGLQVRGSVAKPVLKERFKSFNAMFDEIHKAQSSWVVSDEQLQSELRVSVSAVVVPAYRSFLGRFSQYLDPGRQTEKYIKFGPEDLENLIDELFDGTPSSSIASRRRT